MRKTLFTLTCVLACARLAAGTPIVLYSNLALDGRMGAAGRPESPGLVEIEPADDFILNNGAAVTEIKFIGIISGLGLIDVAATNLEIYRVFPADSENPPDGKVPTRVNSPSDVALDERGFLQLTSLTITVLARTFTPANSVKNGISVGAGGEGAVTGREVEFDAVLASPFILPADHYFFVPQIGVTGGDFYWLSASRPIVPPGTPISPDLQAWIRNGPLDPDWLRIGTDIVGGATPPTFNMAFELDGESTVPEPTTLVLLGVGLGLVARRLRRTHS